jgi:phosphoribosylaminoimidazole-succinocarboxamide synthase
MTEVIRETDFKTLGRKKTGKVRDIYEQPDKLILITTDRHSSFDRIIAHIPWKGQVLNQVSAWWFNETRDIVPNHVLAVPDPNVTVGKKMKMVPVEAVMRGYLTGVTDTSIWTRYQQGQREFGDLKLSDGLKKNTKLPHPVFDPTTKEEGHDRAITPAQMIEEGLITKELFQQVKETATKLFLRGQEVAMSRGLILVDTKYEFGLDERGALVLIDEIHTPDSSRYWQLEGYEESLRNGTEPKSFDKEFLRLWFKANCDPYKDKVLPEAPAELVEELSRRYIQMYEQITGEKFIPGELPALPRMERNLKSYAI